MAPSICAPGAMQRRRSRMSATPLRCLGCLVFLLIGFGRLAAADDRFDPVPIGCAAPIQSSRVRPGNASYVYVFVVNGLDPLNYGNLTGLRDHIRALGFEHVFFGQLYHAGWIKKEI